MAAFEGRGKDVLRRPDIRLGTQGGRCITEYDIIMGKILLA